MKLSKGTIKLISLIPLKEAEKEAAAEEDPFAGAEDDAAEEGGEEEKKKPAESEAPKPKVKFNVSAAKKYNNGKFLSDEGEIISADKTGMKVRVMPDDVVIHINFQDIA